MFITFLNGKPSKKRDPKLWLENETLGDTTQTIEATGYGD